MLEFLYVLLLQMWKTVLLCCLVSLSSFRFSVSDSVFRHGAVVENRGKVVLVDSYIYLKITADRTARVPEHLYNIINSLQTLDTTISKVMGKGKMSEVYEQLRINLKGDLERVREKAEEIFNWFPKEGDVNVHDREKRAVLAALGVIGLGVVATAAITMAGINTEKIIRLESLVDDNSKRIDQLELTSVLMEKKLGEVINSVNTLNDVVGNIAEDLDRTNKILYLFTSLRAIESDLDYNIEKVKADINKIVAASTGKVTAELLPVQNLVELLNRNHLSEGYVPLYWGEQLFNYYSLMKAYLSSEAIIVEIPVRLGEEYNLLKIIPFPTKNRDQDVAVILDMQPLNLLISKSKQMLSNVCERTLDSGIRTPEFLVLELNAIIVERVATYEGCQKELALNHSYNQNVSCGFQRFPDNYKVINTEMATYLYFEDETEVFVRCGDNETTRTHLVGNAHVEKKCSVWSKNWAVMAPKKLLYKTAHGEGKAHHGHRGLIEIKEFSPLDLKRVKDLPVNRMLLRTHDNNIITISVLVMILVLTLLGLICLVYKRYVKRNWGKLEMKQGKNNGGQLEIKEGGDETIPMGNTVVLVT